MCGRKPDKGSECIQWGEWQKTVVSYIWLGADIVGMLASILELLCFLIPDRNSHH